MDERNPAPLGNHEKPLLISMYRGFIIPGFLGWCRISWTDGRHAQSANMHIYIYIHIEIYISRNFIHRSKQICIAHELGAGCTRHIVARSKAFIG